MTPNELKYLTYKEEAHFFNRKTMKFFGDRMSNYGVTGATINTDTEQNVEVWELYRKQPVKYGLNKSAYFDKKTYKQRFPITTRQEIIK